MTRDAHDHGTANTGQLYARYRALVYRRACRFFPSAEAEDLTQDVFLRVMQCLPAFRAESSPATWLFRMTTNLALNRLRDQSRRLALLDEKGAPWLPPPAGPSSEATVLLGQLWRRLPEELLQVGVYAFVDGLTQQEIADVMGLSRRTVAKRLDSLAQACNSLERAPEAGEDP